MTEEQPERWDAPNQQVVRADASHPADEGRGGAGGASSLDEMTKDQLLDRARSLGATPANASMTKDELRAAIEAHERGDTEPSEVEDEDGEEEEAR